MLLNSLPSILENIIELVLFLHLHGLLPLVLLVHLAISLPLRLSNNDTLILLHSQLLRRLLIILNKCGPIFSLLLFLSLLLVSCVEKERLLVLTFFFQFLL